MYIKKLFFLILFLPIFLFGQYEEKNKGLYSRYKPGILWHYSGFKPFKADKLHKYDRLIVDISYNDWSGDINSFESPINSVGINVALMFDRVISKGNTFSLGFGIGYSHFNNKSRQQFTVNLQDNYTTVAPFNASDDVLQSKLGINYLEIPIELRLRTKGYQHFKLILGGKIGYSLNFFTKTKFDNKIENLTIKEYKFPDSNPLRYGVTVRVGIRNWAIYGAYYFSSLFTGNKSITLYPYNLGISISLF